MGWDNTNASCSMKGENSLMEQSMEIEGYDEQTGNDCISGGIRRGIGVDNETWDRIGKVQCKGLCVCRKPTQNLYSG